MNILSKPAIIYLQCHDEYGVYISPGYDVSWCDDNIGGNDEPYIRASIFLNLLKIAEEVSRRLLAATNQPSHDLVALQAIVEAYRDDETIKTAVSAVKKAGKPIYDEEE